MSYETELRNTAYQIWQKCVDWSEKVQQNRTTLTPEQQAEMATWSQIPSLFEPFAQLPDPDGGAFTSMIDDLKSAMTELTGGEILPPNKWDPNGETVQPVGDMSRIDIGDLVDGWSGNAAQNFKSSFINPFKYKVQSQFIAVYTLRSCMQAYQNVWRNARADVMKLADKTLDAVDSDCGPGLGGGAAMALTVVSSVAAVAGTAVSGGGSLVLMLAVVGAATQVGGAAAGQSKEEINVSGADPLVIVPKLRQALTQLAAAINREQDEVYTKMKPNLAAVDAETKLGAEETKLIIRKPELAKATRGTIKDTIGRTG